MKLAQDKAQQFFSLYIPLLWYTYMNYYDDNTQDFYSTHIETKIKVRNILCGNSNIIDAAIKNVHGKFAQEGINIVQKWKNFKKGTFIVLKYLKKCSLFLESSYDPKTYGVVGITDELSEIIPGAPRMVDAVLLEFDDRIICDGLFKMHNVYFGKGARQDFINSYKMSKSKYGIISESFI